MSMIRTLAAQWHRRLRFPGPDTIQIRSYAKMGRRNIHSVSTSPPSPSPRFNLPHWKKWFLGSVLTLIVPFWDSKSKKLLKLESEVEAVVGVVEEAADVVEKVATMAEKVSSEVADKLPENGELKDALHAIEHLSKEAADEAHIAKDIIHKIEDLKDEVESLVHPVTGPLQKDESNEKK